MSSYYFYAANKASEKLRFLGGPHVVVEQRKIFLVAFNFDYKYLDSGHTRPPVLEKKRF